MYCMECGTQLPDTAKFCGKCGAKLPLREAQSTAASPEPKQKQYSAPIKIKNFYFKKREKNDASSEQINNWLKMAKGKIVITNIELGTHYYMPAAFPVPVQTALESLTIQYQVVPTKKTYFWGYFSRDKRSLSSKNLRQLVQEDFDDWRRRYPEPKYHIEGTWVGKHEVTHGSDTCTLFFLCSTESQ